MFPALENDRVLDDLAPRFFTPRLLDKPQNPIMDSLKLSRDIRRLPPLIAVPEPLEKLAPIVQVPTDIWAAVRDTRSSSKVFLAIF